MPDRDEPDPAGRQQARREYSSPWSTLGLALLVILVVGGLVWWVEFRPPTAPKGERNAPGIVELPAHLNPTAKAPEAAPGRAAPDFELRSRDGALVRLSSYRGRVVLINFWASWCGPCRAEAPDLNRLASELTDRLVVLGVNQQESQSAIERFAREFALGFPTVLDVDGDVSQAYRVGRGLPVSFLVGPDGVVLRTVAGPLRAGDLAGIREVVGR